MLAGVSVAIGRHFNIDVTIVRVAFAVLTILGFTGLAYLGAARCTSAASRCTSLAGC